MDLSVVVTPATPAKKRRSLSLFFASAFIRRSPSTKKKAAEAAAPGGADWKTIVDCVRPLNHMHHLDLSETRKPAALTIIVKNDSFHDVLLPPPTPPRLSTDGMSRYASAEDLCSLDKSEEEVAAETVGRASSGGEEGGNEIDIKAEEFIAKFYEQMRLQRFESD